MNFGKTLCVEEHFVASTSSPSFVSQAKYAYCSIDCTSVVLLAISFVGFRTRCYDTDSLNIYLVNFI